MIRMATETADRDRKMGAFQKHEHCRAVLTVALTLLVASVLGGALVIASTGSGDGATRGLVQRCVCWGLVVGGVTGTFLAGLGARCGWLIMLGMQPLWIAYALVTGQYGFVLGSVAYAGAQVNGYLRR